MKALITIKALALHAAVANESSQKRRGLMRPQPQWPKKKRSGILRSEVFSLRYQQHGVPMGIKIAQKLY